MADDTPSVEQLIENLVEQTADHIDVSAFRADVDALIAAVRAENTARLSAIASVLQQQGDTAQNEATGQAFCAAAAYVREQLR